MVNSASWLPGKVMSNSVKMLLRSAGWSPNRQVDHDAVDAALHAEGYAMWVGLSNFLAEYSGLIVGSDKTGRSVWFDADKAARGVDPEWPRAYADVVGSPMVPVGGYSHMTVYFGQDGRLYGGFDDEFGLLGASVSEALERLLLGEPAATLDRRVPD
jgi:hypothetical protein